MIYNIYRILSGELWNGQNKITDFKKYELIKITDDKEEADFWNEGEDIFVEIEDDF